MHPPQQLLRELDGTPSATAFVGALCAGIMNILAAPSGMIAAAFGSRRTCLVGAAIAVAGTTASAYTSSISQLYGTYGVVGGIGHSLSFQSALVLVPQWCVPTTTHPPLQPPTPPRPS